MARYLAEEVRIGILMADMGPTFAQRSRTDKFFNCPISITNGALIVSGDDSLIGKLTDYIWDVTGFVESSGGSWVSKYNTFVQASVRISRGVVPVGGTGRYKMSFGTSFVSRYYDRLPSASGSGVFFDSLYIPATPSGSYAPSPNYILDGQSISDGCEMIFDPDDKFIEFTFPGVYARSGQALASAGDYVEYKFACNATGVSLTSSKPSREDPVDPAITQVNRIYTRGRFAHVFYTYANIDYTEVLVKGDGPIWWALGDGYIKKALIFDRFAWVYIGSGKYLCRDLGQDLSLYG